MKNLNKLLLFLILAPMTFAFYGCGDEETVYGDWIKTVAFGGNRQSDAASFVIGNKGYIFGGRDIEDRLNTLWEFDLETGNWRQLADCPGVGRTAPIAFAIGTKGYAGLGYAGENLGYEGTDYLNDFYEIDIETNTWTKKKSYACDVEGDNPSPREGSISFSLEGKGYVGCGNNKKGYNDFYAYDPATDVWTIAPATATTVNGQLKGGSKRYHGTSFVYNNEAYIIGGIDNASVVTDFWKFNATTQKWTWLNEITDKTKNSWDDDYGNMAREYPCVFVIDDVAYMTCGSNRSGSILTDLYAYDFAVDRWDDAPAFEGSPRTAAVAFTINNRGFILTGRSGSYPYDDMWEYYPNLEYDTQTK